jgi:hypothetical protein
VVKVNQRLYNWVLEDIVSVLRYLPAVSIHREVKYVLHHNILEFVMSLRCIHRGQDRSRYIDESLHLYQKGFMYVGEGDMVFV